MRWLFGIILLSLLMLAGRLMEVHRHHFSVHGHTAPFSLHADTIVKNGSIGIPGITKMYEAQLTNYGIFPVSIKVCKFLDDTLSPGTMIPYSVERWNKISERWEPVVTTNSSDFCKPYPLGIIQAQLTTTWLWPGQTLATGEEATAARDPLTKGDVARFIVHSKIGETESKSISTAPFPIDESPTIDTQHFE